MASIVFSAGAVHAQSLFTGLLTGHIGAAVNGDVGDATTTAGVSLAVVDISGFGAEIDVAHTGAFDKQFFADSSVTSFMVNFIGLYPDERFRPFVTVGAGLLRLRTSLVSGQTPVGHTKVAWDAGGGLFYMASDFFALRGDVRYFRLFERPTDLVLRDSGFFDYWRSSIGATFSWPIK